MTGCPSGVNCRSLWSSWSPKSGCLAGRRNAVSRWPRQFLRGSFRFGANHRVRQSSEWQGNVTPNVYISFHTFYWTLGKQGVAGQAGGGGLYLFPARKIFLFQYYFVFPGTGHRHSVYCMQPNFPPQSPFPSILTKKSLTHWRRWRARVAIARRVTYGTV